MTQHFHFEYQYSIQVLSYCVEYFLMLRRCKTWNIQWNGIYGMHPILSEMVLHVPATCRANQALLTPHTIIGANYIYKKSVDCLVDEKAKSLMSETTFMRLVYALLNSTKEFCLLFSFIPDHT